MNLQFLYFLIPGFIILLSIYKKGNRGYVDPSQWVLIPLLGLYSFAVCVLAIIPRFFWGIVGNLPDSLTLHLEFDNFSVLELFNIAAWVILFPHIKNIDLPIKLLSKPRPLAFACGDADQLWMITLNNKKVYVGSIAAVPLWDSDPFFVDILPMMSGGYNKNEMLEMRTSYLKFKKGEQEEQEDRIIINELISIHLKVDEIVSISNFEVSEFAAFLDSNKAKVLDPNLIDFFSRVKRAPCFHSKSTSRVKHFKAFALKKRKSYVIKV